MFEHVNLLHKALDASWKRNEIIANNIANSNTPNFKRSEVQFESILQSFLKGNNLAGKTTHEKHIPIGVQDFNSLSYRVVQDNSYSTRLDGNNVEVDVEMGEEAKNTILYQTLQEQMNNHFKRLKLAINEGK